MSLASPYKEGVISDLHLIYHLVLEKGAWLPVNLGRPNLCLLVEFPAMKATVSLCPEAFPKATLSTAQQS